MPQKTLDSTESITLLVESFYTRVKLDPILGDIFNKAENFSWDTHIPVMVSFWEAVLLNTTGYKGNAMAKHIELHRRTPLTSAHFDRWKELFYTTLDSLFEGPAVDIAKKRVEAMSALIQFKIGESANKGFIH